MLSVQQQKLIIVIRIVLAITYMYDIISFYQSEKLSPFHLLLLNKTDLTAHI